MGDGLPDCFANDWKKYVGQNAGIAGDRDPYRFLDQWIEGLLQRAVPACAQGDSFSYDLAEVLGPQVPVFESSPKLFQARLLRTHDEFTEPCVLAGGVAVGPVLVRQVPLRR